MKRDGIPHGMYFPFTPLPSLPSLFLSEKDMVRDPLLTCHLDVGSGHRLLASLMSVRLV